VIVDKNPAEAESKLLALPGLKKFSDNLKTEKEREDFRRHLRRYVNIYLPECAFEVTTTNRYTVVTHEASITARRFIRKGEVIKYLCGIQVLMTQEEEEYIQHSRRDFSIVISSRNKQASLFLGPARFANHDCGANAELVTGPNQGMMIKARQDIEIGEEITVTYGTCLLSLFYYEAESNTGPGNNYFGEDNCECLCKTCEDNYRNGWSKGGDVDTIPKMSIEDHPSGLAYSLRRRRNASDNSSRNQSETPEVNLRPHVPKRTPRSISRFKDAESPLGKSLSTEPSQTPVKRKSGFEPLSPSDSRPLKKAKADVPVKMEEGSMTVNEELMKMEESVGFNVEVRRSPSPPSSSVQSRAASSRSSPEDAASTDATSVDEETIIVEMKPISLIMAKLNGVQGSKRSVALEQEGPNHSGLTSSSEVSKNPAIAVTDCGTPNSELASPVTTTSKSGIKRKRKLPRPSTDLDHAPAVRVPGDYVLTPALLGEPESAWINCKICEEPFVQKDAYYTRSSCPRCERHSKLYGYMWPKTDKEGKHDTEERILDHRMVHRFIRPSEERTVRRRDRSSTGSRAVTREVSEVVLEKSEVLGRRGGRQMVKVMF
jgi:[histone H4]-N-methyl-L-lysine20 N-methyltransferase